MRKRDILTNTSLLACSRVLCKVLLISFHVLLARYLGAAGFGKLSFGFALSGCLLVLSDLGLSTTALREIARDPVQVGVFLRHALLIKVVFGCGVLTLLYTLGRLLHITGPERTAILLIGVGMVFLAQTQMLQHGLMSTENSVFISLSFLLQTTLLAGLGMLMMRAGLDVDAFALAYLISNGLNLAFVSALFLQSVAGARELINGRLSFRYMHEILGKSLPVAASAAFVMVYFRIGTVLVRMIDSDAEAGQYGIAFGVLEAFLFLSASFRLAVLPVLSRLVRKSRSSLTELVERSLKYNLAVTFGISLMVFLCAEPALGVVLGSGYKGSVPILKILIWALPLCFMNDLFNTLLISADRQRSAAAAGGTVAALNVLVNAVLVPMLGGAGAAMTYVLTESMLFLVLLFVARGVLPEIRIFEPVWRPLLALSVALTALHLLNQLSFPLWLIAAALAYISALTCFGTFNRRDKTVFLSVLNERERVA